MSTIRFLRTFLAVAHHGSSPKQPSRSPSPRQPSASRCALETELAASCSTAAAGWPSSTPPAASCCPKPGSCWTCTTPPAPAAHRAGRAGRFGVGGQHRVLHGHAVQGGVGPEEGASEAGRARAVGQGQRAGRPVEDGDLDAAFLVEAGRKMASTRWTPLYEEELVVIARPARPAGRAPVWRTTPAFRPPSARGCRSTACCAAWPCR